MKWIILILISATTIACGSQEPYSKIKDSEQSLSRQEATKLAILEKLAAFKAMGITVKSCRYSTDKRCSLAKAEYIREKDQEELLLGLVNLHRNIVEGKETRKLVFIAKRHQLLLDRKELYYNDLKSHEDEEIREDWIQAHMHSRKENI